MADQAEVIVGGRPISDLRVVDLKKELEKRGLGKSGTKRDLIDRLETFIRSQDLEEAADEENGEGDHIERSRKIEIATEPEKGGKEKIILKVNKAKIAQRGSPSSSSQSRSSSSSRSRSRSSAGSRSGSRSPSPEPSTLSVKKSKNGKEKSPTKSRSPSKSPSKSRSHSSGSASSRSSRSRSPTPNKSLISIVKEVTPEKKSNLVGKDPEAPDESFHTAHDESMDTERPSVQDNEKETQDSITDDSPDHVDAEKTDDGGDKEETTDDKKNDEMETNDDVATNEVKKEEIEDGEIEDSQPSQPISIKQEILSPLAQVPDVAVNVKEEKLTPKPPRKRRWGTTKATPRKQPMVISSDSLKTLMPEIKPVLASETLPETRDDSSPDEEDRKIVKIRRTVIRDEESDEDKEEKEEDKENGEIMDIDENRDDLDADEKPEKIKIEKNAVTTPKVYRTISTQGTRPVFEEPQKPRRTPSPAHNDVTTIIHVRNLVRPFTVNQLKALLGRSGTIVEDSFWIDKIKSHCLVTFESEEEAKNCRDSLHGTTWPQSNPKALSVDYATEKELKFHEDGGLAPIRKPEQLLPERSSSGHKDQDLAANSDRPLLKERDGARRRSRSRSPRRVGDRSKSDDRIHDRQHDRDRDRSRDSKAKKAAKKLPEEPPAKLLDDLFRKTKALPSIYWLPLTEQQSGERVELKAKREQERAERIAKHRAEKDAEDQRRRRTDDRDKRVSPDRDRRRRAPVKRSESHEKGQASTSRERPQKRERQRSRSSSKKRN